MKNIKGVHFYPVFINHNIFLTKEERYDLYAGKKIFTIGSIIETSVIQHKNDRVFEKEIFVNYEIDTDIVEDKVEICNDFYKIHISANYSNSELNKDHDFVLEDMLDQDDGGKNGIFFKHRKIYTHKHKNYVVLHTVDIKDIELLKESYCLIN